MDGKRSAHICAGMGEQGGRWAGGQKDEQSSAETQSPALGAPAGVWGTAPGAGRPGEGAGRRVAGASRDCRRGKGASGDGAGGGTSWRRARGRGGLWGTARGAGSPGEGAGGGAGQDAERPGGHRPLTDALGPALVLHTLAALIVALVLAGVTLEGGACGGMRGGVMGCPSLQCRGTGTSFTPLLHGAGGTVPCTRATD